MLLDQSAISKPFIRSAAELDSRATVLRHRYAKYNIMAVEP